MSAREEIAQSAVELAARAEALKDELHKQAPDRMTVDMMLENITLRADALRVAFDTAYLQRVYG